MLRIHSCAQGSKLLCQVSRVDSRRHWIWGFFSSSSNLNMEMQFENEQKILGGLCLEILGGLCLNSEV